MNGLVPAVSAVVEVHQNLNSQRAFIFLGGNRIMNVFQMKKLLRNAKPERFKISDSVKFKIERIHQVRTEDVMNCLQNPDGLICIEQQPSREAHDETYGLVFEKSRSRKLFVVITYKILKDIIFIVTAFYSSKKLEKLIKRPKIRKSHG